MNNIMNKIKKKNGFTSMNFSSLMGGNNKSFGSMPKMNFSSLTKGNASGFNKTAFGNKSFTIPKGFTSNTTRKQFMASNPSRSMQFRDTDGDGYINRIDCMPFNSMKQGSMENKPVKKNYSFGKGIQKINYQIQNKGNIIALRVVGKRVEWDKEKNHIYLVVSSIGNTDKLMELKSIIENSDISSFIPVNTKINNDYLITDFNISNFNKGNNNELFDGINSIHFDKKNNTIELIKNMRLSNKVNSTSLKSNKLNNQMELKQEINKIMTYYINDGGGVYENEFFNEFFNSNYRIYVDNYIIDFVPNLHQFKSLLLNGSGKCSVKVLIQDSTPSSYTLPPGTINKYKSRINSILSHSPFFERKGECSEKFISAGHENGLLITCNMKIKKSVTFKKIYNSLLNLKN